MFVFVFVVCCVGSGACDKVIACSKEYHRVGVYMACVSDCECVCECVCVSVCVSVCVWCVSVGVWCV